MSGFSAGRPSSALRDLPTRGRRRRRPDDNRFLPKDAAAWRRLIARARVVARILGGAPVARPAGRADPTSRGGPHVDALGQAAQACAKAVAPPGHRHRESVFLRLYAKGMAVWSTRGEARAVLAGELEALADACAEILDRGEDANAVRERKDIDG